MKKIAAIAAAVITAMTMTGCGQKFVLEGSSTVYSNEDLLNAAKCLEVEYMEDNTEVYVQLLGDMSYDDTARYVNMYYYDHDDAEKEISGDYLEFRVTTYTAKTPYTLLKAIGDNMFDINGFRNSFFGGFYECIVKKEENGEWKLMGDYGNYVYTFSPDTDDVISDDRSQIYSLEEREEALNDMLASDVWNDFDGILLYAGYAGDESASKEELEKLNKRNGTAYDECMVISADIYSNEEQAVLRDTKWQLAKENGVWRVVEYSASKGENK